MNGTNDKQVTVFGGTGFIGRYVVDRLCDKGFTVRVATRSPASAYFLRTSGAVGQVVPVACDIFNSDSIRKAIDGSRYVVNLIGILAEKGKKQTFQNIHEDFPEDLGKIADKAGVKHLVHISALGANKKGPSKYAQSKAAGERAITKHFPQAVILRPSLVFGPEDKFFNRFATMAKYAPFLPSIGGGKTKFQPVYVGDVAEAVMRCLLREPNNGDIFELGGDDKYTFHQLMGIIFSITHQPRPLVTVPFGLAKMQGAILQYLPGQLLTIDQVRGLSVDNVLSGKKPGLRDLGIDPTPLAAILPTYLSRYCAGGAFAARHAA